MQLAPARAGAITALVKPVLVIVAPLVLASLIATTSMDAPVRPGGAEGLWLQVRDVLRGLMLLLPLGAVAAWRTWVHAARWCAGRGRGGSGIAEAVAFACGIALLVLLPGSLRRPLEAPPYVIVYGGIAAVVGLAVGLVLYLAAAETLRLCGWPPPKPTTRGLSKTAS